MKLSGSGKVQHNKRHEVNCRYQLHKLSGPMIEAQDKQPVAVLRRCLRGATQGAKQQGKVTHAVVYLHNNHSR